MGENSLWQLNNTSPTKKRKEKILNHESLNFFSIMCFLIISKASSSGPYISHKVWSITYKANAPLGEQIAELISVSN